MNVGDAVNIDSYEGFGGLGHIIATRNTSHTKYRVAMVSNTPPPFWAHDSEISIGTHPRLSDGQIATYAHIFSVQGLLSRVIDDLTDRRLRHDASKLQSPEKEIFEEYTPKLTNCTYGSDEYKSFLVGMQPALEHHYANNSHHPEHYPNGIKDMSLQDLIEMIVDWKAATLRHVDGDIYRSIEINQKRFGYSDELKQIFLNTVRANGY